MDIDTYIASLRDRLSACPLTRDQLAEVTGGVLSASWISKFASGVMQNPRADTLKALDTALTACGVSHPLRRKDDEPVAAKVKAKAA